MRVEIIRDRGALGLDSGLGLLGLKLGLGARARDMGHGVRPSWACVRILGLGQVANALPLAWLCRWLGFRTASAVSPDQLVCPDRN
jgi:hypothetical protein